MWRGYEVLWERKGFRALQVPNADEYAVWEGQGIEGPMSLGNLFDSIFEFGYAVGAHGEGETQAWARGFQEGRAFCTNEEKNDDNPDTP